MSGIRGYARFNRVYVPTFTASLLVCVIFVGFLQGSSLKNSVTQKHGNAEAVVIGENPDTDGVETSLSGTVKVVLRVEGNTGLTVEPVAAIVASQDWSVRRRDIEAVVSHGSNSMTWEQAFYLEPNSPKIIMLNLVPLRYRENPDDAWTKVEWDPVPVKVTTEIADLDVKQLRDITPPESVPATESDYRWLAWGGIGLLALAIAAVVFEVIRRMRPESPAISADQRALSELDAIQKMNLPAAGDGIRHLALVAEVARGYFERRFNIKATGQTTAEFLQAIQHGSHLNEEQFNMLREALDRCDLAKFAQVNPTADECNELAGRIHALIVQTKHGGAPFPPI